VTNVIFPSSIVTISIKIISFAKISSSASTFLLFYVSSFLSSYNFYYLFRGFEEQCEKAGLRVRERERGREEREGEEREDIRCSYEATARRGLPTKQRKKAI
jgi:hypothetical protein